MVENCKLKSATDRCLTAWPPYTGSPGYPGAIARIRGNNERETTAGAAIAECPGRGRDGRKSRPRQRDYRPTQAAPAPTALLAKRRRLLGRGERPPVVAVDGSDPAADPPEPRCVLRHEHLEPGDF